MFLIRKTTLERVEARIEPVSEETLKVIRKDKRFGFDWKKEKDSLLYQLKLREEGNILGIISLEDVPSEYRIHIRLLEVSKENVGKNKQYDNIAGCLIAFTCIQSFKKGYLGFVSLKPKTRLIPLYTEKYGFKQYGRMLATELDNSNLLIEKYLPDEERFF